MSNNICYIAVAGSGKTTHLVRLGRDRLRELHNREAPCGRLAYLSFTINNQQNLRDKIQDEIGLTSSVEVFGWYQFLLKTFIRPYKRDIIESLYDTNVSIGFIEVPKIRDNGKCYLHYKKGDLKKKFLCGHNICKDYIAEFAFLCIEKNKKSLSRYLHFVYDTIYIDEAQDLSGYDFEILKFLIERTNINVIIAGDPKQRTYVSAHLSKNKRYSFDSYCCEKINKDYIIIDAQTLSYTHRCVESIASLASRISPNPPTVTCQCQECLERRSAYTHNLRGVYWVAERHVANFIHETEATTLIWNKSRELLEGMSKVYNMGAVKGLERDAILLCPTEDMLKKLYNNSIELSEETQAKFYVALTRPRYILAILVPNDFNQEVEGIEWYEPRISGVLFGKERE